MCETEAWKINCWPPWVLTSHLGGEAALSEQVSVQSATFGRSWHAMKCKTAFHICSRLFYGFIFSRESLGIAHVLKWKFWDEHNGNLAPVLSTPLPPPPERTSDSCNLNWDDCSHNRSKKWEGWDKHNRGNMKETTKTQTYTGANLWSDFTNIVLTVF